MVDEFEGYRIGDITYCIEPHTNEFFPVRVVRIGRSFLDVVPLDNASAAAVSPEFATETKNRRFVRPRLPPRARFGGCDERTVNAGRVSGKELRLLPSHYATQAGAAIKDRHARDAERWPLPTGVVYERWFKDAES